ncbi:MAG: hypothetical protein OXH96_08060, partial [Spirochaetaceae bacterium]|nr:hypothetical protein [Spirochaetaceae bacterium]
PSLRCGCYLPTASRVRTREVLVVAPDRENVILVSIDQWRRLERRTAPDIKELLLAPKGAHGDADPATAAASAPIYSEIRVVGHTWNRNLVD